MSAAETTERNTRGHGEAGRHGTPGGQERSLSEVLDRLSDVDEDDKVSINDVLEAFEDRSSGVLITMLGLVAALPIIGAVPGISMTTGALIVLVVLRSLIGGGPLRLPGRVGRLGLSRERYDQALDKGRRWTKPVDRVLAKRLTALTDGSLPRALLKLAAAVLALTMFPLAFVPWGVTPPAFGIVAFGLAMIARDGLLALIGYAFCLATAMTILAIV